MSLQPFFQWCDASSLAEFVRDSRFIFPAVESIHLLAMTVLLGTIILVSIRMLGAGLRGESVYGLGQAVAPLTFWSLIVMVITGTILFTSEANKCYSNPPFWAKMEFLFLAIVFHYTFVRSTVKSETAGRIRAGLTAVVSLVLWFGVGMAGRAIGFY